MGLQGLNEIKERIDNQWIRLHWCKFGKIWDKIFAVKNITSSKFYSLLKWKEFIITWINIESQEWNWLLFKKKILLDWFCCEFNPQRFSKN